MNVLDKLDAVVSATNIVEASGIGGRMYSMGGHFSVMINLIICVLTIITMFRILLL
jgi:hypothetical protein